MLVLSSEMDEALTLEFDVRQQVLLAEIPIGQPGLASLQDYQSLIELGLDSFNTRRAN